MSSLYDKLAVHGQAGAYPFHMPGHKRNGELFSFVNPFLLDITEIDGFDNLHDAHGILKHAMDEAASVYGADRTYFLINGSTSGLLSAISAVTANGDEILIARNCHKSVYHTVFLRNLIPVYCYPQNIDQYGINGGLIPEEIEILLKNHPKIKVAVIVSPTYDGVVSDIKKIADIVHKYKIPLIVDEAHGAHFSFGNTFPESALSCGADMVIQSIHKTLPSLTQTALLHVKSSLIKSEELEKYLDIYQSSSPSYILMAAIDSCIRWMNEGGRRCMERYEKTLDKIRKEIKQLKKIRLLDKEMISRYGIYDLDTGKIVLSVKHTSITGKELYDRLRLTYHLQPEMCTDSYVILITSVSDKEEMLYYLSKSLKEIDESIEYKPCEDKKSEKNEYVKGCINKCSSELSDLTVREFRAVVRYSPSEADHLKKRNCSIGECIGRISAEFAYIYPPGIPILVPGEEITEDILEILQRYRHTGLKISGLQNEKLEKIQVLE